jgi:hypoxanthine phosphoribosyltransferase
MQRDIDRVLIAKEEIAQRVKELAQQIMEDHSEPKMAGEAEITIVPILTGAMIFCCDLIRQISMPMKIGVMTVSSYPGKSLRTQGTQVLSQQLGDVKGRHVVILDDILDSGGTIRAVVPVMQSLGAATVKVCVLLRKDREAARGVQADYVGFEIPDEFVVGYGLDYNDFYRNLPDIVTLKSEVIGK